MNIKIPQGINLNVQQILLSGWMGDGWMGRWTGTYRWMDDMNIPHKKNKEETLIKDKLLTLNVGVNKNNISLLLNDQKMKMRNLKNYSIPQSRYNYC